MAKLIYSALASLDGYVADQQGNFDWAAPDEEVHAFVNDLERSVSTHLFGRRMYEVMAAWETMGDADAHAIEQDFAAMWRAADKIVYSRTLTAVSTARTRIERDFDPDAVRRMKATAEQDMSIGGPELAARAIEAGLVDEFQFFLVPFVAGGGTQFLPGGLQIKLELLDQRRFGSGAVYLRYRVGA